MRLRLHRKLVAAFVAALIASGGAQAMLLMRCGPAVSASGCCPGHQQQGRAATVVAQQRQCCEIRSLPSAPARTTP